MGDPVTVTVNDPIPTLLLGMLSQIQLNYDWAMAARVGSPLPLPGFRPATHLRSSLPLFLRATCSAPNVLQG